jgi:UV excision repair protein RAD23
MKFQPKTQTPSSSTKATTAAPSTPAPATLQTQTPAAPAPAAPTASDPSNVPASPSPAPLTQATPSSRRLDDPNALAIGDERAAAIANMESMGFARADIDRAMRAAFSNPDRAVEYLLTVCLCIAICGYPSV